MPLTVKAKYIRMAPRKIRLVADMVRGQEVEKAKSLLDFAVKKSSLPVLKLLNSGVANAKSNLDWEESNLYIKKITVDEGPKLKRWRPRSRGMASPIEKKVSHITIVLAQIEERKKGLKKKKSKIQTQKVDSLEEAKKEPVSDKKETMKRPEKVDRKKTLTGKESQAKIFRRKSI